MQFNFYFYFYIAIIMTKNIYKNLIVLYSKPMKYITNKKDYNKQYFINKDDISELKYISSNDSNIKYILKNLYNELWIDDIERVDMNKDLFEIDYIIEDNNNNNNNLVGNSNYIYQYFINLFPNNEYEFELTKIYSCKSNKEVKSKIIKKKFSNNLLVRYIEIYFILHKKIIPLNIDLNIIDMKSCHSYGKYSKNMIRNFFMSNENNKPLIFSNKINFYDDDNDPNEDDFLELVKSNYKYNFTYDNLYNVIYNNIRKLS